MATGLFNLKQVNQAISQGAWSGYIAPKWVEYLVVAGGGGGFSGGGGGGGLLSGVVTVLANTSYTVTVGAGGTGGASQTNGADSVFGSIAATGGGKGAIVSAGTSASGGSGGGGVSGVNNGSTSGIGGQGISSQGNRGGKGFTGSATAAGGGGGAGTVGLDAPASNVAGNGGAGIASDISGTRTTYAGGGGGGAGSTSTPGAGGVGGGGAGANTNAPSGGSNTGGGGGGIYDTSTGGAGGSGIVVVRYPGSVQFFTGGTLSYANGYMIHTFYASGTLAPTTPTPYVTDYQISRSLRFNSADGTSLDRTPSSATNRQTFTISFWAKNPSTSGTITTFFAAGSNTNVDETIIGYWDGLYVQNSLSSASWRIRTNAVYRDPSAWYHYIFAFDLSNPTQANRLKIYVNGVESTYAAADGNPLPSTANSQINNNIIQYIGRRAYSSTGQTTNAYMAEFYLIDGQALTPSSFGYTDPDTGVWSPLAFVGTYGTNGFYLNFSDNSNTTAATLGRDYSGNGNNWTPNNFSVTAGAGNDSLVDSPTSYGTDTGVGGTVRGNYATMNPLSQYGCTFANGNLDTILTTTASPQSESGVSNFGVSSGKWYCEIVSTGGSGPFIGIADASLQAAGRTFNSSSVWSYYVSGSKYNGGTATAYGASWTTNDVIGIALDMDAGTVTFYKNGASQGVAFSGLTGRSIVAWVSTGTGSVGEVITFVSNFGQRPFAYTAPSGFKALCTQNLPTPTIGATSTTLATSYFNPITWSGNGASTATFTVGFQPDFVWSKTRNSGAYFHTLFDSVRGGNKTLFSNSTQVEASNSVNGYVSSFDPNGFSVTGGNDTNGHALTYVAWNWRASNATAVTNTAGSITSTVSANTTSGFSVVTYTGTGAVATVGHGIGTAPSMIIVKSRSASGGWAVYHRSLGATKFMELNSTGAAGTSTIPWNDTEPTSNVFTIGTWTGTNASGVTLVAYCFSPVAGYSSFGQYTGNGSSTDGAFVYTGFRPAYVMLKRTTDTSVDWVWWVMDNKRGPYNATTGLLSPNSADAENSSALVDFVSNGFKLRNGSGSANANGVVYIYAAFAENPFKYSLAR